MKQFLRVLTVAALLSAVHPSVSKGEEISAVPRFGISGYRIEGNTLLDAEEVRRTLAPFTGSERDFGAVQQALEALQEEYRRRGFSTVHVLLPEQELERGEVRLLVVEGRLKAVTIQGNRYFDEANIRRSIPGLVEGRIPVIDSVSASLNVANENPSKKLALQLKSLDRDDELVAHVQVTDERPWRVGLLMENTGSEQTGDWRLGALLQHANLFNRDHILTLQYSTSPERPSRVGIYSAAYRVPLYSLGDSVDFYGGYSDVDSGTVSTGVYDLKVSGRGIVSGVRYNQNLRRTGGWEHRLVYGFDYRIYDNAVDVSGIPLGTEIAVHPVSLSYGGDWKGEGIAASVFVLGLQNIKGGRSGGDVDFKAAGAGSADYRLLRYGGSLTLSSSSDWQERIMFNGQYTDNRLVAGEQYGLGGATSVRGFAEREVTGDWGHLASEELYTPDLCRLMALRGAQCRLLGFFDVGHTVRVRPQPGDPGNSLIAAGGVGLRLGVGNNFSLAVDYGIVALEGGAREQGDDRVHLKASLLF